MGQKTRSFQGKQDLGFWVLKMEMNRVLRGETVPQAAAALCPVIIITHWDLVPLLIIRGDLIYPTTDFSDIGLGVESNKDPDGTGRMCEHVCAVRVCTRVRGVSV